MYFAGLLGSSYKVMSKFIKEFFCIIEFYTYINNNYYYVVLWKIGTYSQLLDIPIILCHATSC